MCTPNTIDMCLCVSLSVFTCLHAMEGGPIEIRGGGVTKKGIGERGRGEVVGKRGEREGRKEGERHLGEREREREAVGGDGRMCELHVKG